jgi:hypothetical protein
MSQQAKFFVDTANKLNLDEDGELLYALDHEDPGVSLDQAIEFLEAVAELTGKSPVLYSGHVIKEQLDKEVDPAHLRLPPLAGAVLVLAGATQGLRQLLAVAVHRQGPAARHCAGCRSQSIFRRQPGRPARGVVGRRHA